MNSLAFTGIEHHSNYTFCYGVQPYRSHELPVGAIFETIKSPSPSATPGTIHTSWWKTRFTVTMSDDLVANAKARARGEKNPQYKTRMYRPLRTRALNAREVKSCEKLLAEELLAEKMAEIVSLLRSAA